MTTVGASVARSPRLERAGLIRLVTVFLSLAVAAALFFAGAGTVRLFRGWLYYGGLLAYLAASIPVIVLCFPAALELVNERGRLGKQGVKIWDKVFGLAYVVLLVVTPVIAGLDVGRFHWSAVPDLFAMPALVGTLLAYLFIHWAMVVNKFAETQVRIQADRDHQVVSTGPYRYVRHPFYASLIVAALLYPLAVGSWCSYAPAVATAVLFGWRTAREDRTLREELTGYEEYAQRVRYRLLPGVW